MNNQQQQQKQPETFSTMPGQTLSRPADQLDADETMVRNVVMDTVTTTQEKQQTVQQQAADFESFYTSKQQYLAESKKSRGKADSPEYTALQGAVAALVGMHRQTFSGSESENLRAVALMVESYEALIDACDAYVGKSADKLFRGRFSSLGRYRQDISNQIREEAVKDLAHLRSLPYERVAALDASTSWGDLLGEARAVTLAVPTQTVQSIAALSTIGGMSSKNFILPPVQAGGKRIFFKREDSEKAIIGHSDPSTDVPFDQLRLKLTRAKGVPERLIKPMLAQSFIDYRPSPDVTMQEWAQYIDLCNEAQKETSAHCELSRQISDICDPADRFHTGSDLNTTRRNVAASRMARLLGIGDVVARSETMKLTDGTQTLTGNGMEEASGEPADTLSSSYGSDCVPKLAPALLRQLSSLQILDNICCQGDRNFGNILIEKAADGSLSRATGIDNDISFGSLRKLDLSGGPQKNAFAPVTGGGYSLVIPHMSMELAQSILDLKADAVRFAMRDLITDSEIEALCWRLDQAKLAIADALSQPNSGVFLRGDAAWAQPGVQNDFDLNPHADSFREPGPSYVRTLMRRIGGDIGENGVTAKTHAQLAADDAASHALLQKADTVHRETVRRRAQGDPSIVTS